jgi:hypothetical protein
MRRSAQPWSSLPGSLPSERCQEIRSASAYVLSGYAFALRLSRLQVDGHLNALGIAAWADGMGTPNQLLEETPGLTLRWELKGQSGLTR